MKSGLQLTTYGSGTVESAHMYISVVGASQYVNITKLGIAFSVNKVCRFMQNPLEAHWKIVKRILRYLSGILKFGLILRKTSTTITLDLVGFSDANWTSNQDD